MISPPIERRRSPGQELLGEEADEAASVGADGKRPDGA